MSCLSPGVQQELRTQGEKLAAAPASEIIQAHHTRGTLKSNTSESGYGKQSVNILPLWP